MLGLTWLGDYCDLLTQQGLRASLAITPFVAVWGALADRSGRWDDRILAVGIPALTLPVQVLLEHGRDMAEGWRVAGEAIDNGAARDVLERLRAVR